MRTFSYVSNLSKRVYLRATRHTNYGLGKNWVPVTVGLPRPIVPRESCPSGYIETEEEYYKVMCYDQKEITIEEAMNMREED